MVLWAEGLLITTEGKLL